MTALRSATRKIVRKSLSGLFVKWPQLPTRVKWEGFFYARVSANVVSAIVLALLAFNAGIFDRHHIIRIAAAIICLLLISAGLILQALEEAADDFLAFEEDAPLVELQENVRNLNNLLAHSNDIVDKKSQRICDYDIEKNPDTFDVITQPRDQLRIIATNLAGWFIELFDNGTKFKVAIASVNKQGEMDSLLAYAPWGHNPSLTEEADFRGSFFSHIGKKRGWDCISDIAAEIEREKASRSKGDEPPYVSRYKEVRGGENKGSIVGVPIIADRKGVVGAFIVKSSKDIFTAEAYEQQYEKVLEFFMVRMRLEFCLWDIKESKRRRQQEKSRRPRRKR